MRKKVKWTMKDVESLKKRGDIKGFRCINDTSGNNREKGKQHKYRAQKVVYDGHLFDSKKEYRRYLELKLMERSGLIDRLELQVPFELNDGGTHSVKYVADFVYEDAATGRLIVEDVKGYRTNVYKKKRRLMKQVHGITILET